MLTSKASTKIRRIISDSSMLAACGMWPYYSLSNIAVLF